MKKLIKKWWFWLIVGIVLLGVLGVIFGDTEEPTVDPNSGNNTVEKEDDSNKLKYIITGEELGDYGRKVVLNANTDAPATKYLYKIPTGKYTVTTTDNGFAPFFIVKDNVVRTGSDAYPEELNYVSNQYSLTAGTNDYNGQAKKSVEIEVKEDESILINGSSTYIFVEE